MQLKGVKLQARALWHKASRRKAELAVWFEQDEQGKERDGKIHEQERDLIPLFGLEVGYSHCAGKGWGGCRAWTICLLSTGAICMSLRGNTSCKNSTAQPVSLSWHPRLLLSPCRDLGFQITFRSPTSMSSY